MGRTRRIPAWIGVKVAFSLPSSAGLSERGRARIAIGTIWHRWARSWKVAETPRIAFCLKPNCPFFLMSMADKIDIMMVT